jgi:small subunit ribosomal protein S20
MPNIQQQKKRVRIAAEERIENLRYTSSIKTLAKRLQTVVTEGDADAIETEHRGLVQLIDRAVSRGALHKNAGARKKSQAARLASSPAPTAAASTASKSTASKSTTPKRSASKKS